MSTFQRAGASDLSVTASIPAVSLTQPPIILLPGTGAHVDTANVVVSGSCQVVRNGTIVTLQSRAGVLGSAACKQDGTFVIAVTLVAGENIVTPRAIDVLGAWAADGEPIVLYLAAEAQQAAVAASGTVERTAPLTATVSAGTLTYTLGSPASISITISGGTPPYVVAIDWGDDKHDAVSEPEAKQHSYEHTYSTNGVHELTVRVTDGAGVTYDLQIAAVPARLEPVSPIGRAADKGSQGLVQQLFTSSEAKGVWMTYGMTFTGVVALWLLSPTHGLLAKAGVVVARSLMRFRL